MDQASEPETRERAVSSEPCSTRPNPFDDSESSRKRRRTSINGSRSRSVDTVRSVEGLSPAGDLTSPVHDDSTMNLDADPDTPHTPDHPRDQSQLPSGAVSSKVTINLRNAHGPLDTIPSSPLSSHNAAAGSSASPDDDLKTSVEVPEVDMSAAGPLGGQHDGTPVTSPEDAGSPPVEVINVQGDEDADYETSQPSVTLLQGLNEGSSFADPAREFPFRNAMETWPDAMVRLASYYNSSSVDEDVPIKLQQWIDKYLDYVRDLQPHQAMISFTQNRALWWALPDLIWSSPALRNSDFTSFDEPSRMAMVDFATSFARLTAHFVGLDFRLLSQAQSSEETRARDPISPPYLAALASLTRADPSRLDDVRHQDIDLRDEIFEIVHSFRKYHKVAAGGTLHILNQLMLLQIGLIPRFPKLIDNLGSICQMAFFVVRECERKLHWRGLSQLAGDTMRKQVALGHQLFNTASTTLSDLMEKHLTNLQSENAGNLIGSLAGLLQVSLRVDHPEGLSYLEVQLKRNPTISPELIPEVAAMEWRYTMLRRLIMCSQMPLRVMAVTNLCTELVHCWKKYGDNPPIHDAVPYIHVVHFVSAFLINTGLVPYLLGPSCHPEITAEAGNIIGFLAVTRTYAEEHSDRLWQTITSTQDPRISEALIRMIARIANLFSYEVLVYLCQKLLTLPVEGFNSPMRDFCEVIFKQVVQKAVGVVDQTPYLVCLRLLKDSSVWGLRAPMAYPEIQSFAIDKLNELIKTVTLDEQGRYDFYTSCLEDIEANSPTTLGSLCALNIMSRAAPIREMQELTMNHGLTRFVIKELRSRIQDGRIVGYAPVISGAANTPRSNMISQIVANHPTSIDADLGLQLWHMLVGKDSACQEDRDAAWKILNASLKGSRDKNPFLATCFNEYLPSLPVNCFCDGMLEFVRESLLPLVNDAGSILLDDDESPERYGIEQLWRIILSAPQQTIGRQAIHTLVNDMYIDSKSIMSFPVHRARKVHLALVARCLGQLSSAAKALTAFNGGASTGDEGVMAFLGTGSRLREQELLFIRSLAVLREFHRLYRVKAKFAAPDLRSLITDSPNNVEGDSAELKFQSFDGEIQTEVRPLTIGKRNTAASLLASLKEATGFENYRIYYGGQAFVPHEGDICKSLEDLKIHNGLILVKRESDVMSSATRIRPGTSPVEIEILGHFDELWEYLSMDDRLAQEVYYFLVRLPIDEQVIRAFQTETVSHREIFPLGKPFKSLYAIHALREYLASRRRMLNPIPRTADQETAQAASSEYTAALARAMSLTVAAICDHDVIQLCASQDLQIFLSTTLVENLANFLRDPHQTGLVLNALDVALLKRLLQILSMAIAAPATENSARLIHITFQCVLDCCSMSQEFWLAFKEHDDTVELIDNLLLHDWRQAIRKLSSKLIGDKIQYLPSTTVVPVPPAEFREFFWPVVLELIPQAMTEPAKSEDVFTLSYTLLKMMCEAKSDTLDPPKMLESISNLLLEHKTFEDITQPETVDSIAVGLIRMLHLVITNPNNPDVMLVRPENLRRQLFWKYLFPPWKSNDGGLTPRVVLNSHSRTLLIYTIFATIGDDPERLTSLMEDLESLVPFDDDDDPYHYELQPQFERSKAVRSSCGYVGLRNLSNTCYLNSLFTQLFMNVNFRAFMLGADIRDRDYSQKLLFHTRLLFGYLQDSVRRFVDPQACVNSIKTYEDTPIDIHNQMDVDEFYNLLFDRWEGQLLSAEEKRVFRSFYGGQLVQQVRSKECDHISERLEPFSAIQCDIKGKTSLEESLLAYVEGEIMEGDNKYKCSTCDRHVDAVKRACLKDIPDNLIFHLKRFDFSLRTLQRNKINDYFQFPNRIDMRPYTIDQLSSPSEDMSADIFELVGVLVHSGTAESGHYYSYIRERPTHGNNEVWVEFNDDIVNPWDPALMESSCFGGADYRAHFDGGVPTEKSFSAYMLFYQRSSTLQKEQEDAIRTAQRIPLRADMPMPIMSSVRDENTWLVRRHCLYDPQQISFVGTALQQVRRVGGATCSQGHAMEDLALHVALGHLDQVASRTKDIPDFQALLAHIQAFCSRCARCCLAVVDWFKDRHEALRWLVQRNPTELVRLETGNLLISALVKIKEAYPDDYGLVADDDAYAERDLDLNDGKLVKMAASLIDKLWDVFHINLRSWPEVFGLMLAFVSLGRHEMAAFLDHGSFKKAILVLTADANSNNLDQQYTRLVNQLQRRLPARQPSYDQVISLVDAMLSAVSMAPTTRHEQYMDDLDRLALAQLDPNALLPTSRQESFMLTKDWMKGYPNILMDKLIGLNQNDAATESILVRLLDMHQVMDGKMLTTLKAGITSHANGPFNTPFLRAAAIFCRHSTKSESVRAMLEHVASCCRGLQNSEGRSFLEFQRSMFPALGGEATGANLQALIQALYYLPTWAPGLLGYFDTMVSNDTEVFIQENLFAMGASHGVGVAVDEGIAELLEARDVAARHLGVACLTYLRDFVLGRSAHIGASTVAGLQRVISQCKEYYNFEVGSDDELSEEFVTLSQIVLEPLSRMIVDGLEEDASDQDWNASDCSSEQGDSLGDISMQPAGDLHDGDVP